MSRWWQKLKTMAVQTSQTVRWGIIGCGQIALDKSVSALLAAKNGRIAAIADLDPARCELVRQACLSQIGDSLHIYDHFQDLLLDSSIDAVYIALPTGMHLEAVLAAATAGKPILCEKPLGRNALETRQMILAAKTAGVPLMAAYMARFSDLFSEAVRLCKEGEMGQITFVYANFSYPALGPYPPGAPGGWRWTDAKGGGALLDIGVYLAFALREMLQDDVVSVGSLHCNTIAPSGFPNPDTNVAWFRTRKGIPGTFAATFSHEESRIIFYGTKGRLEIQDCFSQSPSGRLELRSGSLHRVIEQSNEAILPHYDNYRREFEHFAEALLTDSPYYPNPLDVLTDSLLLDALRCDSSATEEIIIPDAQTFLKEEASCN